MTVSGPSAATARMRFDRRSPTRGIWVATCVLIVLPSGPGYGQAATRRGRGLRRDGRRSALEGQPEAAPRRQLDAVRHLRDRQRSAAAREPPRVRDGGLGVLLVVGEPACDRTPRKGREDREHGEDG